MQLRPPRVLQSLELVLSQVVNLLQVLERHSDSSLNRRAASVRVLGRTRRRCDDGDFALRRAFAILVVEPLQKAAENEALPRAGAAVDDHEQRRRLRANSFPMRPRARWCRCRILSASSCSEPRRRRSIGFAGGG